MLSEYSFGEVYIRHAIDDEPDEKEFTMHIHDRCEIYFFISGNEDFLIFAVNAFITSKASMFGMKFDSVGAFDNFDIKKYFDKYVDTVVIIGSIRKIKTKKAEDMGFMSGSDETGTADFIIFPKNNQFLNSFRKDDFVKIRGQVTRRNDKFQIVVSNIELID